MSHRPRFLRETSRFGFVIYDFRHTFATRAAESWMPVVTLEVILGHADRRSVMKYIHVRRKSQDREMELFEAKNISEAKRWSGLGCSAMLKSGKSRDRAGRSK